MIDVLLPLGVLAVGLRAPDGLVIDVVDEGHVELAEVGDFRRPVVHLHVDVGMNVAIPCRAVGVVPDALQVARQSDASCAADHQVTSKGKVQFLEEERIKTLFPLPHKGESLTLFESRHASLSPPSTGGVGGGSPIIHPYQLVRREDVGVVWGEGEAATVKEAAIIPNVFVSKLLVGLCEGVPDDAVDAVGQQAGIVDVAVVALREIRVAAHDNHQFVGSRDAQSLLCGLDLRLPAARLDAQAEVVVE